MSVTKEQSRPGVDASNPSADPRAAARYAMETRLLAIEYVARYNNVDIDRELLRIPAGDAPSPAAIVAWIRDAGLWSKAIRMRWGQLMKLEVSSPVVLLLKDGSAAILTTIDIARDVVWLKDPRGASGDPPVAVDELRLSQVWSGETLLVRVERGQTEENAPFNLAWLGRVVWQEKKLLRQIFYGSLALAVLALIPPLVVMTVIDKVLTHQSYSTLLLIAVIVGVSFTSDAIINFSRRVLMMVLITLLVLLPVLFVIQPTLTWIVIALGGLIAVIVMVFMGPVTRAVAQFVKAETQKHSVMIETIHGIRTIKSLALEPQQREMWDMRTADSTHMKMRVLKISNWPQSLTIPLEGMMSRGALLIGVWLALQSGNIANAGGLIAFMMLSSRMSQPLIGLAKVMEDIQEVRVSIGMAGLVLNQKPEVANPGAGLRPKFEGAIAFQKVDYAYPGAKSKALDGITFEVAPGTMLGLVGRSGSGKSTVTRLLQGISRDYEGFIKIDGNDLREMNLAHMRRNFGVVLQENFLFRGTIRENIIGGRPGLTLTDAVRAARLAGAEEFIERMPNGYETFIEEGSPNLSGGQRQRLAIARGLIHDPRLLILDEATSALDPESEALVNANLQRIAKGRTMVIVSHRLSSLTDCDMILVLDRGKVVDMAPHIVLVERCSIYRQLWLQQNRHLESGGMPRGGMPAPVIAQGD